MKIKLTEIQYNRLLLENDKDFLDGQVKFPNIGNKVDKFIVKMYNYIHKEYGNEGPWESYLTIIRDIFNLSEQEARLLSYNYIEFSSKIKDGNYEKFIGNPLIFFGEFEFSGSVPVSGYVYGDIASGKYSGYGTSYKDFMSKLRKGDYEDVDVDWDQTVDFYSDDIDWDINNEHTPQEVKWFTHNTPDEELIDNIKLI